MAGIKYKSNCKGCQLSKHNPKARDRIRKAAFRREDGDETIQQIAIEFGVTPAALYKHCRNHLKDTDVEMSSRKEIKIAKKTIEFKARVQKEHELLIDDNTSESIEGRPAEIVTLDDYIAQGAAMVKEGKVQITANSYLAAIKIKNEWQAKQQNNKVELLKTIAAFRSGHKKVVEGEVINGIAKEITGSTNRGADETARIYRRIAGDAATSRAEEILT